MGGADKTVRLPASPLPGVPGLQAALILTLFAFQSLQVSASYGRFFAKPVWLIPYVVVPGLAALAGQVAMRQLEQGSVRAFLRWLTARLGPALLLAVVVAALAIGPLVTLRPMRAYFTDPELWSYFLNLLFWPQFTLPGVFGFNNVPLIVNDILWVLPAIPLVVLGLCATALRPGRAVIILLVLFVLAGGAALALELSGAGNAGMVRPVGAVVGFLAGALGQAWRGPRLPRLPAIAIAAGLIVATAFFNQRGWGNSPGFNALIALPAGYIAVSLSALPLPRLPFGQHYLGGLLLLGFPVQQACIALGSAGQGFVINMMISLPVTLLIAVLSWHLFERRLAGLVDKAAPGVADDDWGYPGAGRPMSLARARRLLMTNLPMIGLWLLFIGFALAVMAMVIFASQPDRGGI